MDADIILRHDAMTDSLQQISDHVWHYPYDPDSESIQPGVGAIITPDETVLVDAGNGPPHARRIRAALLDMDAPPVSTVIYTHFHWDHTFGAQVWRNSRVVAHSEGREHLLTTYGDRPWSPVRAEDEMILNPAREAALQALMQAIGHWQDFELILPYMTFTGEMTLMLGSLPLNLRHIGGQHASDSITIQVDDVLFLGDCYYPPVPQIRQPEDTLDFAMIERLLAMNATCYIEGHNQPKTHTEFAQLLEQR